MTIENVLVNIVHITQLQPLLKAYMQPGVKQQSIARSFNRSLNAARIGQK